LLNLEDPYRTREKNLKTKIDKPITAVRHSLPENIYNVTSISKIYTGLTKQQVLVPKRNRQEEET
jgi:hypothetical protein